MGRSQDLLGVGEGALQERDNLIQPPRVPVGEGEVVAGGQGVWVGRSQDLLGVDEGALQERDGLVQPPRS